MKHTLLSVGMIALIAGPTLASANTHNSFSGSLSLGTIIIDSGNNLNPESSKKNLDSLESAADRKTSVMPGLLSEVTWDVGEPDGVKFYLTTDPPIDEVGGFSFNLGTSYAIEEIGIIDTAAFFTPFEKAWQNPYITGVDREETDTSKYGFRIGLNRIMGTGFRAQLVYLNESVDNDTIGELVPELARDGAVYSLNMNYSHYIGEKLELRPRMSVRMGDYKGDANSFVKYKFDFEARYKTGQWLLVPRVYFSHSEYDEVDPVFEKTRKNNGYGVSLLTTYIAPFDWQKWSVACLVDISRGDSNINFYDTESMTVGALLSYHF